MPWEAELYFTLGGTDVLPEQIEELVGLKPTASWRQGESIPRTALKRKENNWQFGFPRERDPDIEEMLTRFLDELEPYRTRIVEAQQRVNLKCTLTCIIYVDEQSPVSYLHKQTLERVVALGAALDIHIVPILLDDDEHG